MPSSAARGTGILDHQLPTAIPRLRTVTQLRPMGIPITDRGTILRAMGTVVITREEAVTDAGGRSGQVPSLARARPEGSTIRRATLHAGAVYYPQTPQKKEVVREGPIVPPGVAFNLPLLSFAGSSGGPHSGMGAAGVAWLRETAGADYLPMVYGETGFILPSFLRPPPLCGSSAVLLQCRCSLLDCLARNLSLADGPPRYQSC